MDLLTTKTAANNVQVWERLRLSVSEAGKKGIYSCRVMEIEKGMLIISRPEFKYGDNLPLDNRIILARFTRADAAYLFNARLVEFNPESPDKMRMTELGQVQRLQQRRFVRLNKIMPVRYFIPERPIKETLNVSKANYIDSKISNISAGGLLMSAKKEINLNTILVIDMITCNFKNLPRDILAICRQSRQDYNKKWIAGVEYILSEDLQKFLSAPELSCIPYNFQEFHDRRQNELVSELFNEQLKMRQKGII
ncbi:MAG: hypothetical protein ABIE07_10680 [Candidatus Zixiibacteriota bacterium]